ncbi:F-box protein SKIP22 [Linum grandiflorum]
MKGESSNVSSGVDEQRDFVDGSIEKSDGCDCMDIDAVSSEDVVVSSKRFSEPYFLRRVLRKELADCDSNHKLLVAAIHAVFLESGFVGYDSLSGSRIHQLQMSVDWPLKQSTLSVFYTLPELRKDVSVELKFQTLGNFLNAYSSLNHLCLNGNTYAPTLRQLWQSKDEHIIGCENEVSKFWKDVNYTLCLPLLIHLCKSSEDGSKRFSESYFLRQVLREELADCDSHHKLLVAAIHAVFLESGFVQYDPLSGSRIDQLHISVDCTLPVLYTLPELLGKDVSAALKFQTLGNFLNAFSSLNHMCLNGNTYAPTLRQLWRSKDEHITGCENVVRKLWKDVKDTLCLPLLFDLCERANLPMPSSCFASLPTDLKLSILTLLPGVDVARMECASKETRYLSSNNDELWKQKFAEEFGELRTRFVLVFWKREFATEMKSKKMRMRASAPHYCSFFPSYSPSALKYAEYSKSRGNMSFFSQYA